jgi:hypothetical protein
MRLNYNYYKKISSLYYMTQKIDLRNHNLTEYCLNDSEYDIYHLEHNNITNISMYNNDKITNLYLCSNKIEGDVYIHNCPNLIICMLNNNNINRLIISDCPSLMFINVCGNIELDDIILENCPKINVIDRNPTHLFPSIEPLLDELDVNNLKELQCNNYKFNFEYNDNYELCNIKIEDTLNNETDNIKITTDKIQTKTKFKDHIKINHIFDDEFNIKYDNIQIIKFNKNPRGKWKCFRFQ